MVMKIKNVKTLLDIIDFPINFSLKSEYEKRQILNQYNQFLKICNFDFQIFIKTKKENVDSHINYINNISAENEITKNYVEYILNLTNSNYIYSKEFYIIFSIKNLNNNPINEVINVLDNMYTVIKENLIKCGNVVTDFSEYSEEYLIKKVSEILNERENSYENFK